MKSKSALALVLLLNIVCFFWNCRRPLNQEKPRLPSANLLLPASVSDATIRDAIKKMAQKLNSPLTDGDIKIRRCPCDSLINLSLPPGWILEGQDGKLVGKPPTGGQSGEVDLPGGGTLLIGFNFSIATFDPSQDSGISSTKDTRTYERIVQPIQSPAISPSQTVDIAVFDSGLIPDKYVSSSLLLSTSLCSSDPAVPATTSAKGWTFLPNVAISDNTFDDNGVQHGSSVTYLLASQFNSSTVQVKIVPMKVLDASNKGDLYGLMCAMKTAQKNGVELFNMSLGYYGGVDSLFRSYMKQMQDAGIWMVVAAGNHFKKEPATTNRNLATLSPAFYPACFAKEFDHIVPITSVRQLPTNTVIACERQNYSDQFVTGVLARLTDCQFVLAPGSTIPAFGTSYATPVAAGWLGRKLKEGGSPINKRQDISSQISDQGSGGNMVIDNKFIKSAVSVP